MDNKKNLRPSDAQDLSTIKADNSNSEDFLIDICRLINNSEEYKDIETKPNFGREELPEERKKIREADNVYTIGQFITNNYKKVKSDRKLQLEIKLKLERLKKLIVNTSSTESAKIKMLELQINDMLSEDLESDEE
jgi:hypothetical protein